MPQKPLHRSAVLAIVAIALALGLVAFFFLREPPATPEAAPIEAGAPLASLPPERYRIPVSVSQPTRGATDALVTIVEWCDLPDPGCAAVEPEIDALQASKPDAVRVVFRHFARGNDSSALAHAFAREAHEQGGKFWQARELLQAHQGPLGMDDVERYTGQLGLNFPDIKAAIDKQTHVSTIVADGMFAAMFEVKDAPALFVNGRSIGSPPSAQVLRQLVAEELVQASRLVGGGVPVADVYAELIKHGKWIRPSKATP